MSDFKAKMHQNRFRLGLRPRPAGGAYDAPPDPLVGWEGIGIRRLSKAPLFSCHRHSPRFFRTIFMSVAPHLFAFTVYCVNCTKFGQLILRIIIIIDATRCQIFRLKCTKIVFGWGSAPHPAGGAHSAPQTP